MATPTHAIPQISQKARFEVGRKTAGSTASALVASSKVCHVQVTIQNLDSAESVYIGHSDSVSSANGFLLAAGDKISLFVNDAADIFVIRGDSSDVSLAYMIE